MRAMPHPVIAFDLDGTLVDTAPDLIATLNSVLVEKGVPTVSLKSARALIGGGVKALLERGLLAQKIAFTPADLDELYGIYLQRYAEHIADHSRPFPGVEAALDRLEQQGYGFAICTNKLEWLSLRLLDALKLSQRFAAICGQDTFGLPKPDPAMFRKTIIKAGGDPGNALLVGDSVVDVNTARAAGVPIIAVDFGYTETPVHLFSPDRVISGFAELPAAVRDLLPQEATSPAIRQLGSRRS